MHSARTVCAELIAAGYIVKVVQMVTNLEYQLHDGDLVPRIGPSRNRVSAASRTSQPVG
jgi:hypothetical protein